VELADARNLAASAPWRKERAGPNPRFAAKLDLFYEGDFKLSAQSPI